MTLRVDNPNWRLRRGYTAPLAPGSISEGEGAQPVLPAGHLGMRLTGNLKPKLNLGDYVNRSYQVPAAVSRPHPGFQWGMLANDRYGDCVIAMMLHSIEDFHLDAGTPVPPFTDSDAIQVYSEITGFNPKDPNSDQGTDENDAMNHWQNPGLNVQGSHQIAAVIEVDPSDLDLCRRGIDEFVALQLGVNLPANWQGQTEWRVIGDPNRDPDSSPGSWGGHGIPAREYDADDFKVVTWGTELLMTAEAFSTYVVQAFVVVSKEMLNNQGVGPSGVAWDDLVSDIHGLHKNTRTKSEKK